MRDKHTMSVVARRLIPIALATVVSAPGAVSAAASQRAIDADVVPPTLCVYTATAQKVNATTIGGQANVTCDRDMWIVDVNVRVQRCMVDLPLGCLWWHDEGVIAHCNWRNLPAGRAATCPVSGSYQRRTVTKGEGYAIVNDFAGTDNLGRPLSGEDRGVQHF